MVTPRDRTWMVAIQLAENTPGFDAGDVRETAQKVFDEDAPSRGTINNTLNAMAELGVLTRLGEQGKPSHYVKA